MEQQEELAKSEFKLKRQANLVSVKNDYINLEKEKLSTGALSKKKQHSSADSQEDDGSSVTVYQFTKADDSNKGVSQG